MTKPNSKYSGSLNFRADNEVVDTQNCTGRIDARQHARHLTAVYGGSIEIYNNGEFLDTVEEW